ncbi:MAG: sensor histidine kinase [Tepidiformaceae bacterium]
MQARAWQSVWLSRPLVGLVVVGVLFAVITAAMAPPLDESHILQVALVYLIVVLLASAAWGYVVGLTSAVVADVLVNFFYVEPIHRFTVQEPRNVTALVLYLLVALIGASMLSLLRAETRLATARAQETSLLLDLSQAMAAARTPGEAMRDLCAAATRALGVKGCAVVRDDHGWRVIASTPDDASGAPVSREQASVAEEALRTQETATLGGPGRVRVRSRQPVSDGIAYAFIPLQASGDRSLMRLTGTPAGRQAEDQARLTRAFADEASLALERSRLATEAQRAEALERADEFKSVLLSSVSHDLRSPLTAIKAAVGSLRDESVPWDEEDRRAFLETIESQTDRLTTTVSDLLEMSRLEGGAVRPRVEPVNLRQLLDEVAASMPAATAGREVVVSGPSETWALADYGLIWQVATNLLENAARYSKPGAPIELRTGVLPGRARFEVHDAGPPIPAGDLPHIFEKFYRGAQEGKTKGTGLGLAIVKAMVDLCAGRISVASNSDGTTFAVELSAATPPAESR